MSASDLSTLLAGGRSGMVACRDGITLDFDAFADRASAWHAGFAAAPGRDFALFLEDGFEFAAALFGAWHAGKTIWLPADALPATIAALRDRVDGFAGEFAAATVAPRDGSGAPAWSVLDRGAEQLVIFTSGSTAAPTAIAKRLAQLFNEVAALEQAFGARLGRATVHATVSHQHIYGLLFRILWPLAAGRPFEARRHAYVEALADAGDALLIASPAHLKRLPAVALPGLRAIFSSGGPLPDAALPECDRVFGQAPIEVYGSSETGGVAWRQRSDAVATAWTALPGVAWRLENELLAIRSPHLPDDAWTATADRAAAVGADFMLLGRADRVLKIEEKRVSLAAVEATLLETGLLAELRVLTLAGGLREQLAVVAVPSAAGWTLHDEIGKKAFGERLRERLLQGLEAQSAPRRWRFVDALPANSQGKATLEALRALFDARRPHARLLARGATTATLQLVVEAGLPQFDGHFPDHPVLPGVAQVEWAVLFGRELFDLAPAFRALEGLKFQLVIAPGMTVTLDLEHLRKDDTDKLQFKFASAKGLHASGRIVFGVHA